MINCNLCFGNLIHILILFGDFMISKKLSLIPLVIVYTTVTFIHPMNTAQQRLGTTASRVLAGTLTTAHYGMAFSPTLLGLLGLSIDYLAKKFLNDHSDLASVRPQVEDLVKQELTKIGYKNHHKLLVKKNPFLNNFAAQQMFPNDYIFIDNEETILEHLSHSEQESSKKYLTMIKGVMQHEGNHLMYHDTYARRLAQVAIPSAIEAFSYFCRKKMRPIKNYWIRNLVKIPTGFAKGYCGILAYLNYKRYEEQRADDGISNTINALTGMKDYLIRFEDTPKPPFYKNFTTHPPIQERVARLDRRIRALQDQKETPESK